MRTIPYTMIHASILAGSFVISLLFGGCQLAPVTKRRQLVLVSDQELSQESVKVFAEMRQKIPVVEDSAQRQEVLQVAHTMIESLKSRGARNTQLDWEVELFDSPEVNAFCLPGGKIGIFSGILAVAKTNAGLAAIIGHEIAHATAHHSAERASQAWVIQQVVDVVSQKVEGDSGKPLVLGALNLGAKLGLLLPFNRYQESEADTIGISYMAEAGFEPNEAIGLWERMARLEPSRAPEWLSTHPDPLTRVKDLEKIMSKAQGQYQSSSQQQPTRALF